MTQEQIDSIRGRMCDEYCRSPKMPGFKIAMQQICNDCPLNELEADDEG